MKKILINLGGVVATLLMFAPLAIIMQHENLESELCIVLLILSILYDIYMYSIIKQNNYIQETKKLFENVFNGKAINSKTEEEKLNWYKVICISMFMDYFNDDKNIITKKEFEKEKKRILDSFDHGTEKILEKNIEQYEENGLVPKNREIE